MLKSCILDATWILADICAAMAICLLFDYYQLPLCLLQGLAKVPTPALLLTGAGVALEIFAPLVTSSGSPPTGLSIAVAGLVFLKLGAEQLGDT